MNISTNESEELTLNLTPMLDVIFQLLIFFMVSTTFQKDEKEIGVELPQASTGSALSTETDEIIIHIRRDGTVVLQGEVVDTKSLGRQLAASAESNPETPVMIRGDRLVHHEDVVSVMDACGMAGLTSLSLGTTDTP